MLKKIDFKLYPIDIYLHIGEDIGASLKQFIRRDNGLEHNDSWQDYDAAVHYDIISIKDNRHSIVIAFENIPKIDCIIHEIVHATYRIYNHIGETSHGNECHAYLSEFIAKEIEIFIDEYKLENKIV